MLFNQVKRTVDRYHLLEKGDRLIVGVSAGVDSMVLLHLLNTYREAFDLSLIVAHVNHGLRPEESEKEAELVQKESERLGLPFEYGRFNVKEFQKLGGLSPQDAARRIRFHFFHDLLKKHYAQKIALGHNADDQVETVLLRLIRGSGLQGLKGILPIREGKVIRPLLEVWRGEIESFAIEKKISFLLDSSNLKHDYLRNRIRLALIPLMEREYQPNFREIILRTSSILREENDYVERGAEEAYQKIVREERDTLSFKFSEYQSLHQAIQWRVLKKIFERIYDWGMDMEEGGWSDVHKIYQKLHQSSPSFLLELPRGVWVEKRYDIVLLEKGGIKPFPPFEVELIFPGRTFIEEIKKEVVIEEANLNQFKDCKESPHLSLMDYESLQFPLKIRNFRPGDRFHPLGVKGTQKLKEFFIDHKVPRFERLKIPLLISGEMIAWIVGYRIDERVKVTEKTKKILKVTVV
ncbi:MAG: tRNA lysidine(34) synthetase TilS [Deltaproteobacteria bacterium CG03_land_8_20_14_0_80_45_14]|nr:MAG: tRNA lysidine(34) synthetase TilS [Deltaproteobacteria bacterium CG03_land_8_20_14_0_80_45_14]